MEARLLVSEALKSRGPEEIAAALSRISSARNGKCLDILIVGKCWETQLLRRLLGMTVGEGLWPMATAHEQIQLSCIGIYCIREHACSQETHKVNPNQTFEIGCF